MPVLGWLAAKSKIGCKAQHVGVLL